MSDPYPPQPPYPAAEAAAPGCAATYYAPPDSVYQNSPYDYDPHPQPYAPQGPANPPYEYSTTNQYGSQYDLSQGNTTPRSFPPPVVPPPPMPQPTEYLSPVSAEYPPPGLHRRGSNAEYYDNHPSNPNTTTDHNPQSEEPISRSAEGDETERNLSGALLGGATGYYLGHKKSHGFLGAVGGALLGNYLGDKMTEGVEGSEHGNGGDGDDDGDGHSSHGRRRRRHRHGSHSHSHSHSHSSHSGSHGHGHHHHHHHHHHGSHGHRRHRSRSRHSSHSHAGSDGW